MFHPFVGSRVSPRRGSTTGRASVSACLMALIAGCAQSGHVQDSTPTTVPMSPTSPVSEPVEWASGETNEGVPKPDASPTSPIIARLDSVAADSLPEHRNGTVTEGNLSNAVPLSMNRSDILRFRVWATQGEIKNLTINLSLPAGLAIVRGPASIRTDVNESGTVLKIEIRAAIRGDWTVRGECLLPGDAGARELSAISYHVT